MTYDGWLSDLFASVAEADGIPSWKADQIATVVLAEFAHDRINRTAMRKIMKRIKSLCDAVSPQQRMMGMIYQKLLDKKVDPLIAQRIVDRVVAEYEGDVLSPALAPIMEMRVMELAGLIKP